MIRPTYPDQIMLRLRAREVLGSEDGRAAKNRRDVMAKHLK